MVATCVAGAVLVTLSVLRPQPVQGRIVWVLEHDVVAGTLITEQDLEERSLPEEALPSGELAGPEVAGSRAAVALPAGTILTPSLVSGQLAAGLAPSERVVQIPVDIGAALAQPGSRVDVIGESATRSSRQADEDDTQSSAVLCTGARVLQVEVPEEPGLWSGNKNVTYVTLAVSGNSASVVVSAATHGALGIVLSP